MQPKNRIPHRVNLCPPHQLKVHDFALSPAQAIAGIQDTVSQLKLNRVCPTFSCEFAPAILNPFEVSIQTHRVDVSYIVQTDFIWSSYRPGKARNYWVGIQVKYIARVVVIYILLLY